MSEPTKQEVESLITHELQRLMSDILNTTHRVIQRKWGGEYSATEWIEGRVTADEIKDLIDEIIREINP